MKINVSRWYHVNDKLPPDGKWKIVRCINGDCETRCFYFMAYYFAEEKAWEFFDTEYEKTMQVTHWASEIIPEEVDDYTKARDATGLASKGE